MIDPVKDYLLWVRTPITFKFYLFGRVLMVFQFLCCVAMSIQFTCIQQLRNVLIICHKREVASEVQCLKNTHFIVIQCSPGLTENFIRYCLLKVNFALAKLGCDELLQY